MRKSKTLARLRNDETVRMCCLGHFIPSYVRHAAHFGFDCIWLDLEHRYIEHANVMTLLAEGHLHDIDIMVRPPTLEKTGLYRYLEDGATGLMIPHVNTADKARMLVDAVKFPPLGDRGLDGAGLDADYLLDVEGYLSAANDETFLIAQIETVTAVNHVEEIAAVRGIDGLFVGAGDLGLRLKHDSSGLDLESCFERVAAACARHNMHWGTPVSTAELMRKRESQGGRILAHGGDFLAIMKALEASAAIYGNRD